MFRFVLKTGFFLAALFVFLEVPFRVVVPSSNAPVTIQNSDFRVMQYDVDGPRQGLYTEGRHAEHKVAWRVNNLGWISNEDYTLKKDKQRPGAVIIGNSYVEAIYLDLAKHLAPVTRAAYGPGADFYTLGAWGVDLSQGIAVTDYARQVLDPDLVVLVVSHGSLRRSVRNLAKRPYCLQVEFKDGKAVVHQPQPFAPSRLGRLLKMSATVRYIRLNAKLALGGGAQQEKAMVDKGLDPGHRTPEQEREQELMGAAAHWIVQTLEEKNPETRFIFLVDADRNAIQAGENPQPIPASGLLSEAVAGHPRFRVLDLTEALLGGYQRDGQSLHDTENYHWNEHAVEIIGSALAGFIHQEGFLPATY